MLTSSNFDKGYSIRLGKLLLLFIVIRTLLGIWMWGVRQIISVPITDGTILKLYGNTKPETNLWLEPWQRWDTPQYQDIAEHGYLAFDTALFTPPLFPFLMGQASILTGGNTLVGGLLISGLGALLAVIAFERLTAIEFGNSEDSFRSVLYLVSFPSAFFLFAAYSESLYIAAAILALYFSQKKNWVWTGIWAGIAGLSRTPGFFIYIPIAYSALAAWKKGDRNGWQALLIGGGILSIFPLYVWFGLQKSPIAILDALRQRGGYLTIPGLNIIEAFNRILAGQLIGENIIELFFTLIFIVLTYFIWKKLPRIYGIYSITLMILFLTRMGSPQPLVSMARYVIEVFPAFMVLAMWGRNPWINRAILYTSLALQLFMAGQFAIWGWVG